MFVKKNCLFCLLCIVITLSGCITAQKSGSDLELLEDIAFYDTVPEAYAAKGYCEWSETDNAIYYFSYGSDEEKTQLVRKAETVIQMAVNQYQVQPMVPTEKFTVSFRKDSVKYSGNGLSIGVEINPQDRNQAGVLTYFISGGKLPAWLCIGLEQYWLDGNGICNLEINKDIDTADWYQRAIYKGLPALGDEWLIPGLITDELSQEVPSVAYAFVSYLDDKNQLPQMIESYLENQTQRKAEQMRNNLWSEFTKIESEQENEYVFYYILNQYMYSPYQKDMLFCVKGKNGNYFYSDADWWTIEKAKEYAYSGESSIVYVKNWFDEQHEEILNVHYIVDDGTPSISGQFSAGGYIFTKISKLSEPIGVAHEVVHVMLDFCQLHTKGFDDKGYNYELSRNCLEEGICDYIANSFLMDTDNPIIMNAIADYLPSYIKIGLGEEYWEKYQLKLNEKNSKNIVDAIMLADLIGLKDIEEHDMIKKAEDTGEKLQYLLGQGSITSFVFYLFELNDDKEEFMKVYKDAAYIEEVYGKDLNSLIEDWFEYLDYTYM